MKTKDKAQEIGQEILITGQSNVGRWMLAAMFVAGLAAGFIVKAAIW